MEIKEDFISEIPEKIKLFSSETKDTLKKEGYLICTLTGKSANTLKKDGMKFWSTETWHKDYPDLEVITSMRSEVAINPRELFLTNSNNKTLQEQEIMVADFGRKLSKKIKGVKAIIGEAPDYLELDFAYSDKTGNYLFGKEYDYDYTRTRTKMNGNVARVGVKSQGIYNRWGVVYWDRGVALDSVGVAPLIVPV